MHIDKVTSTVCCVRVLHKRPIGSRDESVYRVLDSSVAASCCSVLRTSPVSDTNQSSRNLGEDPSPLKL